MNIHRQLQVLKAQLKRTVMLTVEGSSLWTPVSPITGKKVSFLVSDKNALENFRWKWSIYVGVAMRHKDNTRSNPYDEIICTKEANRESLDETVRGIIETLKSNIDEQDEIIIPFWIASPTGIVLDESDIYTILNEQGIFKLRAPWEGEE